MNKMNLNTNIALVTTFNYGHWHEYVEDSLVSWCKYLPAEIPIIVCLEPEQNEVNQAIIKELDLLTTKTGRQFYSSVDYVDGQKDFLERTKNLPVTDDYRTQLVRFSWKVFAQYEAMKFCTENNIQYLVWLDADVIANAPVQFDGLYGDKYLLSYLGRKDWDTSETGFIMYNLNNGGSVFIDRLHKMYTSGQAEQQPQFTDAWMFDRVIDEFKAVNGEKKIFLNLSEALSGRDVFDESCLGKFFEHKKGNRKFEKKSGEVKSAPKNTEQNYCGSFGIITKNCVDDAVIEQNVRTNLQVLPNNKWVKLCVPNDDKVVICSAGSSLDVARVRELYLEGYKVVAVKHALKKLLDAGIIPWGCVLLDPRTHVNDFVEYPHPQVNYFVASMCDPNVIIGLLKRGANVWGYHAHTTGNMEKLLPQGHLCIFGGSATATRSIMLMRAMGFRDFTLLGYDLCYDTKPDLSEQKTNGKFKYDEVTITCESWGGAIAKRTFWTEGQFLAQAQEYKDLIFPLILNREIKVTTEGFGVIPWLDQNLKSAAKWDEYCKQVSVEAANGRNINGCLAGSGF